MIRRDDGGDWLIIEQIEHARLAAEMHRWLNRPPFESKPEASFQVISQARELHLPSKSWQPPGTPESFGTSLFQMLHSSKFGTLIPAAPALWIAVILHDEGWTDWDQSPRVDPANGIPRSFLEMRMRDATAIWTQSIAACSEAPLAGYAVSRHFCYLAEQVRDSGRHDPDDCEAVERFLSQQADIQEKLAQAARNNRQGDEFEENRELGFRTVQFFDRVSLWLCCAERHEAEQMTGPRGERVTFIPRPWGSADQRPPAVARVAQVPRLDSPHWDFTTDPSPRGDEPLELRTRAKRIPARRYADDVDLQATLSEAPTVQLMWRICPA